MFIGISRNGLPYILNHPTMNGHWVISGKSGTGKSTFALSELIKRAEDGDFCLVFNVGSVLNSRQFPPLLWQNYEAVVNRISVVKQGIPLNLFDALPGERDVLKCEDMVAERVTNTLMSGIRSDAPAMRRCVLAAVKDMMETGEYHTEGIAALGANLEALAAGNDGKAALRALGYFGTMSSLNYIQDGELFDGSAQIIELDFTGIDLSYQYFLVQIVLCHLFNISVAGAFSSSPLTVFLDECQNLDFGRRGILYRFINESRKFNVNLMFITPSLEPKELRLLYQCAIQVYFCPLDKDRAALANNINPKNPNRVNLRLRKLGRGYFLLKVEYADIGTKSTETILSVDLPVSATGIEGDK